MGVRRPRRETVHFRLVSRLRLSRGYTSTPNVLTAWCFFKRRDNFILTRLLEFPCGCLPTGKGKIASVLLTETVIKARWGVEL